jgi:hypothetical protein
MNMQGLPIAGVIMAIFAWLALASPFGCRQSCTQTVKSEREVQLAVAGFFSSDTGQARRLIADLRKDGMTDEYFDNLKAGCVGCYIHTGRSPTQDPKAWYAFVGIAPSSAKKDIELLVECTSAVWLDRRLYGG